MARPCQRKIVSLKGMMPVIWSSAGGRLPLLAWSCAAEEGMPSAQMLGRGADGERAEGHDHDGEDGEDERVGEPALAPVGQGEAEPRQPPFSGRGRGSGSRRHYALNSGRSPSFTGAVKCGVSAMMRASEARMGSGSASRAPGEPLATDW